jgi:hypothetical protein
MSALTLDRRHDNTSSVKAEVVEITPKIARSLLERSNGYNYRKMSHRHVQLLGRDMESGNWDLNGEAIIVDESGRCIDGQHRLAACVSVDTSFPTVVITVPNETCDKNIDRGKCRRFQDLLAYGGVKHATHVSGAVRLIAQMEKVYGTGMWGSNNWTNSELEDVLNRHPAVVDWTQMTKGCKDIVSPSLVSAPMAYVFPNRIATIGEEFVNGIKFGNDMVANDPRLVLRNKCVRRNAKKRETMPRHLIMAEVIKAWNAFCRGRKITTYGVAYRVGTDYPMPIKP